MISHDPVVQMFERLLAIDWSDEFAFEHGKSRSRLMLEYLRRTAWWAQALDATEHWPFFDIASHIDPTTRADPGLVDRLKKFMSAQVVWSPVRKTCIESLHWAALQSKSNVRMPDLEDPFEPLIMMYERGGGFTTEHGFIDVGLASVRRKTWRDHLTSKPITSLDSAVLDALDADESWRAD